MSAADIGSPVSVSSPSPTSDRATARQPDDLATVLLPPASDLEVAAATEDARLLSLLFDGIHGRWNQLQMYEIHGALAARLAEYRAQFIPRTVTP